MLWASCGFKVTGLLPGCCCEQTWAGETEAYEGVGVGEALSEGDGESLGLGDSVVGVSVALGVTVID
jgi:hypothetical protein